MSHDRYESVKRAAKAAHAARELLPEEAKAALHRLERISWVYGQLRCSGRDVTMEEVTKIVDDADAAIDAGQALNEAMWQDTGKGVTIVHAPQKEPGNRVPMYQLDDADEDIEPRGRKFSEVRDQLVLPAGPPNEQVTKGGKTRDKPGDDNDG